MNATEAYAKLTHEVEAKGWTLHASARFEARSGLQGGYITICNTGSPVTPFVCHMWAESTGGFCWGDYKATADECMPTFRDRVRRNQAVEMA